MTWYQDLVPCDYFGEDAKDVLLAVGWLSRDHAFPNGRVEDAIYTRLSELLRDAWQPAVSMGLHECDLCVFRPECRGSKNLFVPGDGKLFVAPELILHYMNAHMYLPPDAFCRAILKCEQTGTPLYRREFLRCGGGKLIKH